MLGVRLAGAALSFGFTVSLARLLGAEGTGMYYLALSAVTASAVVSRLGMDNALVRFVAVDSAAEHWSRIRGLHRSVVAIALVTGTAVTAVVAGLAPIVADGLFSTPELETPLRWMTLAILPLSLSLLHAELLKGLHHAFAATLVQTVVIPGASLLALMVLVPRWGVSGAVWAYVAAAVVACAAGAYLWHAATPMLRGLQGGFPIRRLLVTAAPLLVVAVLQLGMPLATTVVLGIWRTNSEVGVFGAASRTAQLTSFFLVAINTVAAPRFAALHAQDDHEALARAARGAAATVAAASSPLLAVFFFAPELTMHVFGGEFVAGGQALRILSLGQFVNVCTGPVGVLLMMSGHERVLMKSVVGASIFQIVASLVLIPGLGMTGAAAANAASLCVLNVSALVMVRRLLRITVLPIPHLRQPL